MKKSYERRTRVSKAIQREIARMLWSNVIKDDRLSAMISIVDVDMSPSLSSARVYFSLMDSELADDIGTQVGAKAALDEQAGMISGELARTLNLKYAPRIHFIFTKSLKESVELINLIDKTVEADEANK